MFLDWLMCRWLDCDVSYVFLCIFMIRHDFHSAGKQFIFCLTIYCKTHEYPYRNKLVREQYCGL